MSSRADGYSGADCAALLREAGLDVLKEGALRRGRSSIGLEKSTAEKDVIKETSISSLQITKEHFNYAFEHVMPSVSKRDKHKYDNMRDRTARARTRGDTV
jgi:ribosome biogenesis ATPase